MKNIVSELRHECDISQSELAKGLSVSRNTISSIETGKYNPSLKLAHRIAKHFELEIEEVFIFEDEYTGQELENEKPLIVSSELPGLFRKIVKDIVDQFVEIFSEDEEKSENEVSK